MSPRKPSAPDTEPEPALQFTDSTAEWLRPRLTTATKEELVALVERLASGSEDIAARIDDLTNPSAAVKGLQRRIAAIRNGKRFIAYDETGQVATEIASIARTSGPTFSRGAARKRWRSPRSFVLIR